MATLANVKTAANVFNSFTYITNDLFDEASIMQIKNEMSKSQSKKWCRTLGVVVSENNCTLEKAKSYGIKASKNSEAKSVIVTLFCNPDTAEEHAKAHETAKIVSSYDEAVSCAKADIA